MNLVGSVQSFVLLLLGIGSAGLTGYAFADVLRRKGTLFPHVGRLSKAAWLGILGAAFAIAIISLGSADLKPKLKQVGGGSGTSYGPYGPY